MSTKYTFAIAVAFLMFSSGGVCLGHPTNETMRAIFSKLSTWDLGKPSQRKTVLESLDIGRPEISQFMKEGMNSGWSDVGTCMASMNYELPEKGLAWFVENYTNFSSVGRANLVEGLKFLDLAEAYQLLVRCMSDKSVTVNEDARSLTPGPDYRVCDCARHTMTFIMRKHGELPAGMNWMLIHNSSYEARDADIKALLDWWESHSVEFLKGKKSLAKDNPELRDKIEAFLKNPLPKAEKPEWETKAFIRSRGKQ